MSKSILIISPLEIWSIGKNKGAPTVARTVNGYVENGWDVHYISGTDHTNADGLSESNIEIYDFDSPRIKRLFEIPKISFFAKILWWIRFQITATLIASQINDEFDIVYGYEIIGVPAAKIWSIYTGCPMVSRFQGTKLYPRMELRFWRIRFWQSVLAYKIPTDLTIMTNDGTHGDVVLDRLNHRSQKTLFLMNGVDKELFSSPTNTIDDPNFDTDGPILLTVSRLVSWKRVDRAIRALPDVVKRHPETTLVIVGDGPEQSSLEEQARSLNVRENIHFAGAVPHDQIPQYLNSADVFLSLFDISNVGNPLLEALTAGCCIVTLDTGATGKVITDGKTGRLLSQDSTDELPDTIIDLLSDRDKRSMLSHNACEFADDQLWTWDERIEEEIKEVSKLAC